MKLSVFVMVALTILTGCTVSPRDTYDSFYYEAQSDVNLIIDTLVISDIRGRKLGVNIEKNNEALKLYEEYTLEALKERNFKVNHFSHTNGLLVEESIGDSLVYSNEWKSTDEKYTPLVARPDRSPWESLEMQLFLKRLQHYSNLETQLEISEDKIPDIVENLDEGYLVLLTVGALDVSEGKSFASALATGLLTSALSGGTAVSSSSIFSSTILQLIIFDRKKRKIVWENSYLSTNYKKAKYAMYQLTKQLPNTDGNLVKKSILKKSN